MTSKPSSGYKIKNPRLTIASKPHYNTVNVENITVFLISLYSGLTMNHREYSVIHYTAY
jgi:hypothetical protein